MRNLKSKGHLSPLTNSTPDSEEKLTLDTSEGEGQGYFQRYASEGSPFEGPQEEEENEDVFSGAGVSGTIDFCLFWDLCSCRDSFCRFAMRKGLCTRRVLKCAFVRDCV